MACSTPPVYWATSIQWSASLGVVPLPGVRARGVERLCRVLRADIAQEVPGGVHEGVESVGLAAGRLTAARTGHVNEVLVLGQWLLFPLQEERDWERAG